MKENVLYIYSKSYERTLHFLPIFGKEDGIKLSERILNREKNSDLICEVHANNEVLTFEYRRVKPSFFNVLAFGL